MNIKVKDTSNFYRQWRETSLDPINCFDNNAELKYDNTFGDNTIKVDLAQATVFKSVKLWNKCISKDGGTNGIKIFSQTGKEIPWDMTNTVVNLSVDRCKKTKYTISYTFKGGQQRNATGQVPEKREISWRKENCLNSSKKENNEKKEGIKETADFAPVIGASVGAGVLAMILLPIIIYVWRKRKAERRAEPEQTGTDLNDIYGTYGRGLFRQKTTSYGYN